MASHICIFEDTQCLQFLPLVYVRPVYDLRCGIFSLREKILWAYPRASVSLQCRESLAVSIKVREPQCSVNELPAAECLFINGRLIADDKISKKIPLTSKQDVVYIAHGQVVAAYLSGKNVESKI